MTSRQPADQLLTERLILRRWRDEDRPVFAAINADPQVAMYLAAPLTTTESDELASRIEDHFRLHGFGLWALQVRGGPSFIGFTGLAVVGFDAHFTPAVEVGWRLATEHWGRGYATEAGRAALRYGFEHVLLPEIVSFTVPANARSTAVMERLDLRHDPADDFDHPSLPEGHPLQRHVLYRIAESEWRGEGRERRGAFATPRPAT